MIPILQLLHRPHWEKSMVAYYVGVCLNQPRGDKVMKKDDNVLGIEFVQ